MLNKGNGQSEGHDNCGPSQLEKRYLCPGSVRLETSIEAVKSPYKNNEMATRGIELHAAVPLLLEGKQVTFKCDEDRNAAVWCADRVSEYIAEYPDCVVMYEYQVDLTDLGINTYKNGNQIDVLIIVPGEGIVIIDHKFGIGWVTHPKWNLQFQAYSYGALQKFGGKWIKCVKLQPELQENSRHMVAAFEPFEMVEIGNKIRSIVLATKEIDAPVVRGKKQCMWCKAKNVCPQWKGTVLKMPMNRTISKHLEMIDPHSRTELYEDLKALKTWVESSLKTISSCAIENPSLEFEGYRVGPGKNSYEWEDEKVAEIKLRTIAVLLRKNPIVVIEPARLKTVGEIKKEFGNSNAVTKALDPLIRVCEGSDVLKKIK